MSQFAPSSVHAATVTFANQAGRSFTYAAVLYLGKNVGNKVVSSPVKNFTIPAGGTLSQDFTVTMPTTLDSYHVYIEVSQAGAVLATFIPAEDVVIAVPEPSALLIYYQPILAECIEDCRLGVSMIMLPVYGIQNPCTGIGLMKGLMIDEAINIGMIRSAGESYFIGAVMYFSDGTTIVPYWWSCPYCPEKFRSPEQLAQHKEAVHQDILLTKATITGVGPHSVCIDPPWCDYWEAYSYLVRWRNDSPFAITGRVSIPQCGAADALVSPGYEVTVYLAIGKKGYSIPVTLTLVGGALPGMVLDTYSFDYFG